MQEAVCTLRASRLLVYPTETFFAIGCLCDDSAAVDSVFKAKQRAKDHILPLLAGSFQQAGDIADMSFFPDELRIFWPGALTLVLPCRCELPSGLVNTSKKVAIRVTSHPLAAQLALHAGVPLVSSSANISGHMPVCNINYLETALLQHAAGVLSGCLHTAGGFPSTIIEPLSNKKFKLLREGSIKKESLINLGWLPA